MSDEVYRGAEVDTEISPTFWRMYDRALVASGLSKAFALPGLRIDHRFRVTERTSHAIRVRWQEITEEKKS